MSEPLDRARELLASDPRKCDELAALVCGWRVERDRDGSRYWFRSGGGTVAAEPPPFVSHDQRDPMRWLYRGEMIEALEQAGISGMSVELYPGTWPHVDFCPREGIWKSQKADSLPHALFLALVASGKVVIP